MKQICIIGSGTAGITVAARLLRSARAKELRVKIFDASRFHYYQPLWTLAGAGVISKEQTRRKTHNIIPSQVDWVRQRVLHIVAEQNRLVTMDGSVHPYDYLVVCPGIELNWEGIEGLCGNLGKIEYAATMPMKR